MQRHKDDVRRAESMKSGDFQCLAGETQTRPRRTESSKEDLTILAALTLSTTSCAEGVFGRKSLIYSTREMLITIKPQVLYQREHFLAVHMGINSNVQQDGEISYAVHLYKI